MKFQKQDIAFLTGRYLLNYRKYGDVRMAMEKTLDEADLFEEPARGNAASNIYEFRKKGGLPKQSKHITLPSRRRVLHESPVLDWKRRAANDIRD